MNSERPKHLFVAVTAHGYGHLSQIAPLVNHLRDQHPDTRLTLLGNLPTEFIRSRIAGRFDHIAWNSDPGLAMHDPWRTDWQGAIADYRSFHQEQDELLSRLVLILNQTKPDLVLSDVPWLPLLAARRLKIPAVAVCSLNWADILAANPGATTALQVELEAMRAAYRGAELFLRPAPSMPMPWLDNTRSIGPLARVGQNQAARIRRQLGLPVGLPLVMLQFGGIGGQGGLAIDLENAELHWLVASQISWRGDNVTPIDQLGLPFTDILASCDAVVTKPGYGSVAEAACNGVPCLLVRRDDWAEEPHLIAWLKRRIPCIDIARQDLLSRDWPRYLQLLLKQPKPQPVPATGMREAFALLRPYLQ